MLRCLLRSVSLLCTLLPAIAIQAQKEAAPLTFVVVSVRPSAPEVRSGSTQITADGLYESGNPLSWLLATAFNLGLQTYVINVPDWAKSARYDVQAKVDEADVSRYQTLSHEQQWALLQPMLTERFKLHYHREQRPFPMYALRVTRGGPRFTLTPEDVQTESKFLGRYVLKARGFTMQQLCSILSSEVPGEPKDQTGLPGRYDIDLHWSRQSLSPDGTASSDVDIFKALREQLGLEMVRSLEPVSVVVIDGLERPDAN